jgi:pimeloyl-ACP methyl ester carboxylesterase
MSPDAERYAEECLKLSGDATNRVRVLRDIAYGADPRQRVDIFLPQKTDLHDLPMLMFMHGGAWTHGTKDWCGFMAPPLVQQPAIFISVGYRLIPSVSFPSPVMDCIAALRWICDHIAEHGGSPHPLFVGGHSAGGQIAALMSLRKDWLADCGLPTDVIKGCFCLATTLNRRMIRADIAPDDVQPGSPTDIAPDSPLALAAGATVSFFIAWGGRDDERVGRTGRGMIDALAATGCKVQSLVRPECDHFSIHLNTQHPDDPWVREVRTLMADAR